MSSSVQVFVFQTDINVYICIDWFISRACLDLLPHKHFTFSKIWLYYAYFEIRQKNLTTARKTLGMALGICPRDKLFRGYIDLEIQLREFDRCRILYEKFLQFGPENCTTWMKVYSCNPDRVEV